MLSVLCALRPLQMVVEKMLAAQGRDRRSMGREAFEAEVWTWKAQYGGFITQQLRRLGASCDWARERFTLDQGLSGKQAGEWGSFVGVGGGGRQGVEAWGCRREGRGGGCQWPTGSVHRRWCP